MFTKLRVRNSAILLLMWLSVPVLYMYTLLNHGMDSFTTIMLFVSLLFFIFSIVIYMGNTQIIAGFNIMSSDELKQYDLDKVSIFSGLCWFAMSLVAFHGSVLVSSLVGKSDGVAFSMISILSILIIWSISISCSKKIHTGDN